ncbi:MAG: hypothetical protein MI784_12365 [Cytophagales bacterium]|nr:hypothetical protein [Cytophagales bacterium]
MEKGISPFKSVAWVSDAVRLVWKARFDKINQAFVQTTVEALNSGHWSFRNVLLEGRWYFKMLALAKKKNLRTEGELVGNPGKSGSRFYELGLGFELGDQESGCCEGCSSNAVTERKENLWKAALRSEILHAQPAEPVPSPHTIELTDQADAGAFWHKMLCTVGYRNRCSLSCPKHRIWHNELLEHMQQQGFSREAGWLRQIHEWPLEWSAFHGIAELRTPILKLAYDTDYTPVPYTIRRKGESYPAEGAVGNRFPYRQPRFKKITDSKSYQTGLKYGN